MPYSFVNFVCLKCLKSKFTYLCGLSYMNGSDKDMWDIKVKNVLLEMQGRTMNINFHVMHMTRPTIVLGCEWLHSLHSALQCTYQSNTLAFENNGMHVLLLGDQDVTSLPFICSTRLNVLVKNNVAH